MNNKIIIGLLIANILLCILAIYQENKLEDILKENEKLKIENMEVK